MESIEIEHLAGGVVVIRLANPPVNAVSKLMMRELREIFVDLSESRDVGAVVLSAKGDRAFCAGIDLSEVAKRGSADGSPRSIADSLDPGRAWRDTQAAVLHCPVPVVAAIDGPAIGAGFG